MEQWLISSFVAEVNHRQRLFLGLFIIVDQHEGMRRRRLVVILNSKLENENGATPTIAPSLHVVPVSQYGVGIPSCAIPKVLWLRLELSSVAAIPSLC